MKKFEVRVELVLDYEVTIYAEDFAGAIERAKKVHRDDVLEGQLNDEERHVVGVFRSKESRLYR